MGKIFQIIRLVFSWVFAIWGIIILAYINFLLGLIVTSVGTVLIYINTMRYKQCGKESLNVQNVEETAKNQI